MSKRPFILRPAAHRASQSQRNGYLAAVSRSLVLVLILFVLRCALPGFAAGSESRPRSVLASVPGLEKRVTYLETKIPLGELVAKVAADTGVPLTAARDLADEPVAVVVNEFPAREMLEELAELLDYRWSRRASGARSKLPGSQLQVENDTNNLQTGNLQPSAVFEIRQDLASKQREEALRQALQAGAEQRFQEGMAICRELSRKSQEEMRRLWDEAARWDQSLEKLTPAERQALLNSLEGRQQSMRYGLVQYLWSPIRRSLAGWMSRLSPEQSATLRSGRQLVFSSSPQPGKLPLPPDVLRVFRTSRPSISPPGQPWFAQPEREEKARQQERGEQERWDQAEQYDVILRFLAFDASWWDPGSLQFVALTAPFRGGKRLGQQDDNQNFTLNIPSERGLPPKEEDTGRRALLERDPVLSVKKPFQPGTRPYVDPLFPGASRTVRLLPELLPELARTYGVDVIADAYWGGGWDAPIVSGLSSIAGPRPLFEVLDGLTGPRYNWDRRGSLIRIRDRKWFLNRPREIPLRTVRRWGEMVNRLGALPLEEFVSAATTLTDLQVDTLEGLFLREIFPAQLNDLRILSGSPSLLRLYGRLSLAQRQALQTGKPLVTSQLSATLRPLVLAQLYRGNRARMPMPDLDQWVSGKLTLSLTSDVRIREQRGRSVTWRLESAPTPRAAVPPDAVTRFPVTRLRFDIHYGGQAPAVVGLIVAADAGPSE